MIFEDISNPKKKFSVSTLTEILSRLALNNKVSFELLSKCFGILKKTQKVLLFKRIFLFPKYLQMISDKMYYLHRWFEISLKCRYAFNDLNFNFYLHNEWKRRWFIWFNILTLTFETSFRYLDNYTCYINMYVYSCSYFFLYYKYTIY